ncbi:MAG: sugar transferase, partial [Syntrophomonadaceae bacterium]|nr:sugar transferase [Syntrophomonadaceae bacterium]
MREYMGMPEAVVRAMEADIGTAAVFPGVRSDIDTILLRKQTNLILKRSYDIVFSLLGLAALLPVFIIIAAAIKIDSPGPVFYTQTRVGKDGKLFKIYKFRKMHQYVGNHGSKLTLAHDRRMTRVGSLLRKTKLDELPQAWNVLIGDMAVVGHRPETPNFVQHYN